MSRTITQEQVAQFVVMLMRELNDLSVKELEKLESIHDIQDNAFIRGRFVAIGECVRCVHGLYASELNGGVLSIGN